MAKTFDHTVTVRLADVDAAGIIFFARYFEFCHAAYEELLCAVGLPIDRLLLASDYKIPIVKTEGEFPAPSRLGERLRVAVHWIERRTTSFVLGYRMEAPDGSLRASCRTVHVVVTERDGTLHKRPIPDDLGRALEQALGEPG